MTNHLTLYNYMYLFMLLFMHLFSDALKILYTNSVFDFEGTVQVNINFWQIWHFDVNNTGLWVAGSYSIILTQTMDGVAQKIRNVSGPSLS